jgi:hypothetical protein
MLPKSFYHQCQDLSIDIITGSNNTAWQDIYKAIPNPSPFLCHDWLKILEHLGWSIIILKSAIQQWILPLAIRSKFGLIQIHSLPFASPAGFLQIKNDQFKINAEIVTALVKCSSNFSLVNNSRLDLKLPYLNVSEHKSYIANYNDTLETIKQHQLGRNIRRKIDHAEQQGYKFWNELPRLYLQQQYDIHKALCHKQNRRPHPYPLFQALYDSQSQASAITQIMAIKNNEMQGYIIGIAGKVEFFLWDIGYTEPAIHNNLPSLLIWEMIKLAKAQGYNRINFGTSPAKTNSSDDFKIRWNTQTEEYFIYSHSSRLFTILSSIK